ncbi:hypothetical protein AB0I81_22590 [Nonomuraea sp. NPDC050404]|uniref:hypothetical protein n=1 Tax=Nonomuraea sp. NPDC050404 TaxID=3155783 RepID=UPI0033EBADF7
MRSMTLARLRAMARAASGDRRRLTIVSGPDGRRWMAWPYGCIELDDRRQAWLDRPVDGCFRWTAQGLALAHCEPVCNLPILRREMLPLLTATNRVSVVPTRWMYEDGLLTRRLLERSDSQHIVVDADLWHAWHVPIGGQVWQIGGRHGALVWASAEDEPSVALLLPVRAEVAPVPPEVAGA